MARVQQWRRYPILALFALCYAVVHLLFERTFWFVDDVTVFDKYAPASSPDDAVRIGERVYYAKAAWCFVLVMAQALGARFLPALAGAFLLYAILLLIFFPIRIYALLNVALAVGLAIEAWVRR